jgi:hypothetical protein
MLRLAVTILDDPQSGTMRGLIETGLAIRNSEAAQSAILTAALAVIAFCAIDAEHIDRPSLEVAFTKVLMSPRPDLLAERYCQVIARLSRPPSAETRS